MLNTNHNNNLKNKSIKKELKNSLEFEDRHIGPNQSDVKKMLKFIKVSSLDELISLVIPKNIIRKTSMNLDLPYSENGILEKLKKFGKKNKVFKSLIGMGYYDNYIPSVILRNVLENPAWYTAYTPYQPEISQGRLEALVNFQTMVCDLTGMEVSNSSLLDEATAAAEAMALAYRIDKDNRSVFLIDEDIHPQILSILKTRANPLNINIKVGKFAKLIDNHVFGGLISYPSSTGNIRDISKDTSLLNEHNCVSVVSTDLLSLTLIKPPGELGADIVIGTTQRFGVPLGFGGPHAAFLSTKSEYQRLMPGRIVGTSIDRDGNVSYRLALQTREQHIRRDKATSNICTAQVLLAVIASFYAIWHGPKGLKNIASKVHLFACRFNNALRKYNYEVKHSNFFDTVVVTNLKNRDEIIKRSLKEKINLRIFDNELGISFDETCDEKIFNKLLNIFKIDEKNQTDTNFSFPFNLRRNTSFLEHPTFNKYKSETEMLRYIRTLSDKDLALDRCMIPLGSCTMKLNATTEMIPITWPEFSNIHPYAPLNQVSGYLELISDLERIICECTGYSGVSFQPNAGSQGEFAGLLAISNYHKSLGKKDKNICLIPSSAHGTNPASAVMAGMKVVMIKCDEFGNVDIKDLQEKVNEFGKNISTLMVTYPSTHGVFEEDIVQICEIIHSVEGQVYVDGANLNALVGHCSLPEFGADVSHLNLHKTFCIPHGGGGPGVGPVAVAEHLIPFLPSDPHCNKTGAVSATNYGSASILPISYAYIMMMGTKGLTNATSIAILSANYIASKLDPHFPVLYKGKNNKVAHECIIDLRHFKEKTNINNEDVAKRLIDYGFHSPTMSFPVPGTLMIEPTESESLFELDRFCSAMISIAGEIKNIELGKWSKENNPLKNAPHTHLDLINENWDFPYSKKEAFFPFGLKVSYNKYWPPVSRIDNAHGDRNLICVCPPIENYA